MSAEKETKESDRLFASVIRSVEERRAEVDAEITEKQKAAERRSEELIGELQQEITELQRRNTELEELTNSEDHLHLLQVNLKLWFFNFQRRFWSNFKEIGQTYIFCFAASSSFFLKTIIKTFLEETKHLIFVVVC